MNFLLSKIWGNIYFMRFRSGLRYWFLNSVVNRIPAWWIRRPLYRLSGVKMGKGCRICLYTIIDYPKGIRIGDRSIINENCFLDGRGRLSIGDDVSISIYSRIITASHKANDISFSYYESSVQIDNNVWLGAGAIVLDGSHLEQGSIIGSGCVFKGLAEKDSIYIGNPAKILKSRLLNEYYRLNYRPWMK